MLVGGRASVSSDEMKSHKHRIFNRINVVSPAKTGLAKAGGPVEGCGRVVRGPHLEDNFKGTCRAQMTHEGLEEHTAQAASLVPGGHGNRFQFRLRRDQTGCDEPQDAL